MRSVASSLTVGPVARKLLEETQPLAPSPKTSAHWIKAHVSTEKPDERFSQMRPISISQLAQLALR